VGKDKGAQELGYSLPSEALAERDLDMDDSPLALIGTSNNKLLGELETRTQNKSAPSAPEIVS
jgi:hypothetical protein